MLASKIKIVREELGVLLGGRMSAEQDGVIRLCRELLNAAEEEAVWIESRLPPLRPIFKEDHHG